MKAGIFIDIPSPEAGGANSLLKTIDNEISNYKGSEFDFVFIYNDKDKLKYAIEFNSRKYINFSFFNKKSSFISRCIRKAFKMLRICKRITKSTLDIIAEKEKIDIFWFTSPGIFQTSYPFIYTIWDLGHRTTPYFPEVSRSGWLWDSRENTYQSMVYKASYILTGNEEGKKEILQNYNINPNKIIICPFPVAKFCRGNEVHPDFEMPEQYFFYPAQFWPHKNHIRIVQAVKILKEKGIPVTVFLTGSDQGNKKYIEKQIKINKLEDNIKFTGFLKGEELKYLYTHATGMIFASLMGPNNMPPIEATFLNCPVIITDLEGHKEQLGDTALYFNGYEEHDLAEKMELLLLNHKLRSELKLKQLALKPILDRVNYFEQIIQILDKYSKVRETWGEDYIQL